MGRQSTTTRRLELDCLEHENKLNIEQQVQLIRPFKKKDVKEALFGIHSSKSPRPDSFGAGFFKGLWEEIGDDISKAVLGFFQTGTLPKEMNETTISLIPKTDSPQNAGDFRPIACCNTIYKCISKMMCTRLSKVLPILIHENQGAFIKKLRSLARNILILQDLLKGYTRRNISARCIMKIDLSKAYDSVDWCFVDDLLKGLYFPSRSISWIQSCLHGASYSLILNGRIQGSFKGEKGLRQGDPMSPLLFVLIIEYLTRLLIHKSKEKGFRFHPLCKSLGLVNLCFADDLIILCRGNEKSVKESCQSNGMMNERLATSRRSADHLYCTLWPKIGRLASRADEVGLADPGRCMAG
uniref:Reverse transcriptase domain-containing protein n=1 Tax=Cannabis sativa TaxID=3483 RepID=A0A803QQG9_CANSA